MASFVGDEGGLDGTLTSDEEVIDTSDEGEPCVAAGSRMVWGPLFREVLALVSEGVKTDLWGLRCPVHCQGTTWSALALSFLLGFICAACLVSVIIYSIFFRESRIHRLSRARVLESPSPGAARLALYGHTRP